ncbi:hypothetical protein niasHS_010512 [Heterodera schachtii]|uniref:Uncharacterized protein n=1 Tax=Heterodera schachtii TaxID=97005 RepID=A0ABD2IZG3_HETSC
MRLVQLLHLALLVQLLLAPVLLAVGQTDEKVKRIQKREGPPGANLVDKSAMPAEGNGMKIRRRRGTKLKAMAGGAAAGLGAALLYKAFKGKG